MTQAELEQYFQEPDIQPTQRQALKFLMKRKVGVSSLYGQIIKHLSKYPDGLSIGEISHDLKLQKSTVSARINEMRNDLGVIKFSEERDSFESGVKNNIWVVVPNYEEIIELID